MKYISFRVFVFKKTRIYVIMFVIYKYYDFRKWIERKLCYMNTEEMILYHGSKEIVEFPEIRMARYNKDFYFGFYCTLYLEQAKRWATRFTGQGYINEYTYIPDSSLNVKRFPKMTEEWLDFIVACRNGQSHDYDIVEGPMANDTIFNYIQNFIDGKISRTAFWELAKFSRPTHQISFHTIKALKTLSFKEGYVITDEE